MKMMKKIILWFSGLLLAAVFVGCGKDTLKITDTILWMNGTHAIITAANGGDYSIFGTKSADDEMIQQRQQLLRESWEVTDSVSADATLVWLSDEGHHTAYRKEMEVLAEAGLADVAEEERAAFIYEKYEMTEEEAQIYAKLYTAYEESGTAAILAWDYSRAMSLIEDCYVAGYYTQTDALDKSLEIAGVIQKTYDSWEAFTAGYLAGYEYWSGESSEERKEIYERLKEASDSPYHLDWDMTLEKSW